VRFERRAGDERRTIETDGGGVRASVDRLRVEQAVGNLIDNALRHGAGAIRVSARQEGDSLELQVADEGAGFPDGFLPHAFERFSRAEQHRGSGGTGLGLAIVAAVAQAHGGSARAAKASEGGGDVSIRIPNVATTALQVRVRRDAHVLEAAVDGERHDHGSRAEPLRQSVRADDVRAGRDAGEDALFL